jgi:hypothetical protein
LLPDRYGYRYADHSLGSSEVVFECEPSGPVPIPRRLPDIVWRAGIDLDPIDVSDDAVRWLDAYSPAGCRTTNPPFGEARLADQRSLLLDELCAAVSKNTPATSM